jgi:aldose 1-epimerase
MNLLKEEAFKSIHNGKNTALYTLKNKNGMVAQVTNFGAILASLFVAGKNGEFADVVQGYDTIAEYINGNGIYQGAIVGRCANRISKGKLVLEGKEYKLAINNGPNHLHGGDIGFSKVVWDVVSSSSTKLELAYLAKDGEENYPGNAKIKVTYTLTDANELRIDFEASTDKTTIVNLAGHSYFNLAGAGSGDVLSQELMINADFFTPVTETSEPTGEICSVKGTPLDFTVTKPIGKDVDAKDEQIRCGYGYDHNFVLRHRIGELGLAAVARDPKSGRTLEVYTTQPGVQLYSANWVDGEKGKDGKIYNKRCAFCLETQHFADAINKPHFPSVILKPGETYKHSCIYKFVTK